MSEKTVYVRGGTNLFGVIGLVLVILKLAGIAPVAAWSWWLVTMPFWLGLAIIAAILSLMALFAGACYLIAWALDANDTRKRRRRLASK